MSRLGSKARFRAALGLQGDEDSTIDPGALASVGVLKPDPAIAGQSRGYVPVLPTAPDAPTPSGEALPDAWNDASAADIGNPGPEVVDKMTEMGMVSTGRGPAAPRSVSSADPGGPAGAAATLVKGAALPPARQPSVLMSYAAKLAGPKTTNPPDESLRLRAARGAGLKEPVAKYLADAMEGAPDKAKRAAELQRAQLSSSLLRALETAGSGTGLAQAVGLDPRPTQIDSEAPIRELMQRRSLEQAEEEAALAQAKAERDAALADPTSQVSRDVQAVLASLPAFAQMPEEQRARISAAQFPQLAKLFESSLALQERRAGREEQQAFQAQQNALARENFRTVAGVKTETGLRGELMGNKVTKDTQEVASAYARVKASASDPSAAGDLALIFGFMKILDPGSVVKETEQATAENARGVPEHIRGLWNKLRTGERLSPSQRKDFERQASNVYGAQVQRYRALESAYKGLASGAGVDPARVAPDMGLNAPAAAPSQQPDQLVLDGVTYRRDPATGEYEPE